MSTEAAVGASLRAWRERRRLTQLELALDAGVSTRHLSFVETGRSRPGRDTVLRIAEQLDVPFRERNRLLLAAGHAPAFPERSLEDPELEPVRQAIDLILSHLNRHGPHLWGHVIAISEKAGGGIRLVDRTNNILESFFHRMKHGERRRSGRKILTQDFEHLPSAAALAVNLTHPDYIGILCGSLDALPTAFANLDASNRSRSNAAVSIQNTTHTTIVETASLSTRDRQLIRTPAMDQRIMAAALSI